VALSVAVRASGGRGVGSVFAVIGVLGFSFKAILVKLGYQWHPPLDAVTFLTLRMIYSTPFFIVMAWWAGRGAPPVAAHDWRMLAMLGFVGYYLSSLLDFVGLQYVTAALERLTLYLYPTIVILLSAWWFKKRITRRAVLALLMCYAGIVLAFAQDLRIGGNHSAIAFGGGIIFVSAILYAIYLVMAGPVIERLGSSRFISWAMLASAVFIFVQFALTRPWSALAVPWSIHALSLAMAVLSTVLPTWLIAEAIRRIGASQSSLVGSLGPIFTIGLGAVILDEPTNALQIVGAALVLAGVTLVSVRPRSASARSL
jgi:drug/metabolite transporter (DMT)-like permease